LGFDRLSCFLTQKIRASALEAREVRSLAFALSRIFRVGVGMKAGRSSLNPGGKVNPMFQSFVAGPFDAERLDVYRVARELLARTSVISRGWRGQADLTDQARRAALSCMLNIAEGAAQPPSSGNKRRHYQIARGSAGEVAATLDAAGLLGFGAEQELAHARYLAARICAMLTRLCGGQAARLLT
jgi:four helix bundle protein